jgi:2-keto-4-pentenoate hydratase/2-oxohepta-3-ene-1,7-dioic acid hydratase in catechol pathway
VYPEHLTEELDYELELAVVLRKAGKWFSPEEAADYIGGYVIFNDITARDIQRREMRSGRMSVTIPEILSHYSALGYSAGDVLSTGTVSGVAGFSPDAASLYLKPGDVMECEIERVGILRNPVVSWEEAHGAPASPRVRW